ncbi:MAG TPA: PBP1A family penicillin-binding protein, partial [Alphaproteobacteria bacterium]|nr:PBP1A family penicillin-binding protein [Alphaproteobacteria bacterium]
LPSPKELDTRTPEISTKIYDKHGLLLYKIYKDKNRTIVPLSKISTNTRLATLAAEDAEFYDHSGFSIKGILRATVADLQHGSLQGGSTITQQLVKNVLLTPERTITRKIKEIILSIEVEATYSKDQILEMYLNEVSYGGTAYGIEEASESYFGKKVEDLNLAEGAFLAGLPKSPTAYSPFGQTPDLAFARQKEVLHLMVVNKFINKDQEQEALNTKINFIQNKKEIKAPHFVMYIRQLLVDKYGEEMVEKGGLEVTTSLDLGIQEVSEKIVKEEVDKLTKLRVGNGAALVVNPQTGEILAMVGSKDYFDIKNDGNVNITTRIRQPGSSIKVVNYAYALAHGYTPASVIDDAPITYSIPGQSPYSPKNYDGDFRGKITLRQALAESRNIPAVKLLASYGVDKMIDLGTKMGITTWDNPSQYGLSLTLGGGGVHLVDLAQVYSTIANYGKKPDLMPILEVKDYNGKTLDKYESKSSQVLDPKVAYSLIDILKDNFARSHSFGLNSALVIKNHPEVAVKTGTSNDLRDNLAAGFNQDYLVVTWVGNNDNSPMSHIASGVTGASPIWNKIMSAILNGKPSIDWKVPEDMIRVNCLGRGEWFVKNQVPKNYCKPLPSPTPVGKINPILDSGASTINH